jgi:DNA-binding LytR/AlgR family response regulator
VESYSYNTLDYLLKPITVKRFLASVAKVEEHFKLRSEPATGNDGYFFIKSGTEHRKILLEDILFFESRKEYVRVVAPSVDVLTYRRLKDIEVQLPPPFARVHQSFIVNMRQLIKIQDNHIHIGDQRIPIGEKFRESVMELVRKKTF